MDKKLEYYAATSFRFYCLDGQCAVYQVESGDTHLISNLDLAVLQCIKDKPVSAADLLTKTGHLFDGETDQYIDALLVNFQQLCLVDVVNKIPPN